jgi:hypothetical protein
MKEDELMKAVQQLKIILTLIDQLMPQQAIFFEKLSKISFAAGEFCLEAAKFYMRNNKDECVS